MIIKYHYKVLTKAVNERIRKILAKISEETEVKMENGVISLESFAFVVIPHHVAVGDFVKRTKGRSLHKVQKELP